MLEMLINPRKAERRPWEMLFIGLVYASLAILLVNWMFGKDPVLSKYSALIVVTFTVMFSMPFMYYTIRFEEDKINPSRGMFSLLKEHKKAIYAFLWLFLGFVIALSFWYMVLSPANSQAQLETYCLINRPSGFEECVNQYTAPESPSSTGYATTAGHALAILTNNVQVLIFTIIFSLVFGAGVIFVLAWNASVIAAAITIFTKSDILALPLGLARYAIHGIPEIAAYFIAALAGGLVSISVIRKEIGKEKFWEVLQDSLNLIIVAVIVLVIAALLEVFVTPLLF